MINKKSLPKNFWGWVWLVCLLVGVVLASLPSAQGVYSALNHTRISMFALFGAISIEVMYLTSALTPTFIVERSLAKKMSFLALFVAIVLNVLSDYSVRVPAVMGGTAAAIASFDMWLLILSIIETVPISTLAFMGALVAHSFLDGLKTEYEIERTKAERIEQQRIAEMAEQERADKEHAANMKAQGKAQCPHCGEWFRKGGSFNRHKEVCKRAHVA